MINVARKICAERKYTSPLLYRQLSSLKLQFKNTEIRQKPFIESIVKIGNTGIIQNNCLPRFNVSHFNFPNQRRPCIYHSNSRCFSSGNDNGDNPEDTSSGMVKFILATSVNSYRNSIAVPFIFLIICILPTYKEWQIWLMKLVLKICLS